MSLYYVMECFDISIAKCSVFRPILWLNNLKNDFFFDLITNFWLFLLIIIKIDFHCFFPSMKRKMFSLLVMYIFFSVNFILRINFYAVLQIDESFKGGKIKTVCYSINWSEWLCVWTFESKYFHIHSFYSKYFRLLFFSSHTQWFLALK